MVSLGVFTRDIHNVSGAHYFSNSFVRREQILRGEALISRQLDHMGRQSGLEVAGVCWRINVRREQVLR